mgnify:FL=1
MGYPVAITDRFHNVGDIIALKMLEGSTVHLYPFRIEAVETPNNRAEFSIGSATALATAGTGWNTIQDASNRFILEPEFAEVIYQGFYGITPSIARVYRQYPSGVDRGSLVGTRNPGVDPIGYISGDMSPGLWPSPITEFYSIRGQHPAFYGYHPYARPSSITVRMNFYITMYGVSSCGDQMSEAEILKVAKKIISLGGRTLMTAPGWIRGLGGAAEAANGVGGSSRVS